MLRQRFLPSLLALVFSASGALAGDPAKSTGKCPVSGQDAKSSVVVDYKGAKLYFCCPACIERFKNEQARYETRANRQLVASGQAEQVGCPITGRAPKPDMGLEVDGTTVHFCCSACKAKVAKADTQGQVDLVFGHGFNKAYKVTAK